MLTMAGNGMDALNILTSTSMTPQFDVVLMDMVMPGKTVICIQLIKQLWGAGMAVAMAHFRKIEYFPFQFSLTQLP